MSGHSTICSYHLCDSCLMATLSKCRRANLCLDLRSHARHQRNYTILGTLVSTGMKRWTREVQLLVGTNRSKERLKELVELGNKNTSMWCYNWKWNTRWLIFVRLIGEFDYVNRGLKLPRIEYGKLNYQHIIGLRQEIILLDHAIWARVSPNIL